MKLDQLRYFLACANFEHVGRAAKFCHISASSISSAVKALEDEFNCELFTRDSKNITLTAKGHILKDEVAKYLAATDALKNVLSQESDELKGHFSVGASHNLASKILSKACSEVLKDHPKVCFTVSAADTGQIIERVLSDRLDLGLVFNTPLKHSDIKTEILHKGELKIVLRENHPIFKLPKKEQIQALNDYPATMHRGTNWAGECENHPVFDQFNITPNISMFFDDDQVASPDVAKHFLIFE